MTALRPREAVARRTVTGGRVARIGRVREEGLGEGRRRVPPPRRRACAPAPVLHGSHVRRALYLGMHSDVESHGVGSASTRAPPATTGPRSPLSDGPHPLGAGTRRRAGDRAR